MASLTIITPTYNRAHTLPKVYDSLKGQTSRDFIWMLVDDGSSDDTEPMVRNWIDASELKIVYLKKKNGGKASALNQAIDNLSTKYAVCLDSDDTFYSNAVKLAISQLNKIADDDSYCGILALRNNPDGSVMGKNGIPQDYKDITAEDVFLGLHLRTELICFYKTSHLKQYRFPEFSGEKFVSPAWMQYEITQKYKYRTSWDKFCQCEYIEDGLTRNKRKVLVKNPRGYTCVKRYSFDLAPSVRLRIKHGIMYDCGCIIGKDKDWLRNVKHKVWAVVLWPAGMFVYLKRFRPIRKGLLNQN